MVLHQSLNELKEKTDIDGILLILNYFLEKNLISTNDIQTAYNESVLKQQNNNNNEKSIISTNDRNKKKRKQKKKDDNTNNEQIEDDNNIHRIRHIALKVYYDGTKYTGLAENVGQLNDQSIERELFNALQKTKLIQSRDTCQYSRSGRTDRGVSAYGQVIALHIKSAFPKITYINKPNNDNNDNILLDTLPNNSLEKVKVWIQPKNKKKKKSNNNSDNNWIEKDISEYEYDKILNNLLPNDIRILGWTPVSDEFSARFSTKSHKMKHGLNMIIGTYDFRNLCKMDVEKVYNFQRTIYNAQIIQLNDDVSYFEIIGQAFLWHQIRCIVSILFLIGHGLEEPNIIKELLNVTKYPGKPSYPLANELPLVLHDCTYNHLQFGYSVTNLWNIIKLFHNQYNELILKAARIYSAIQSLDSVIVSTNDLIQFYQNKIKIKNKKLKNSGYNNNNTTKTNDDAIMYVPTFDKLTITWKDAIDWMSKHGFDLHTVEQSYTPLLERSMGTSYEEKIHNMSDKRKEKYITNVIKKRKTNNEDQEFYKYMSKQGGSAQL